MLASRVNKRKNGKSAKPKKPKAKNLKTKKKVKTAIKRKFGNELANMSPDQLKHLKQTTTKALKKADLAEKRAKLMSAIGSICIRAPGRPGQYQYQYDVDTLLLFIQTYMDYLSSQYPIFNRNDGVTPSELRMYLFSLAMIYLKKVGSVTGICLVRIPEPMPVKVPNSFMKYLEMIAPFKKNGITQSMVFTYNKDFTTIHDFCGFLDDLQYGDYANPATGANPAYPYQGFPKTMVFAQTTVPQPAAANPAVPSGQVMFNKTTLPTPVNFSDWMSTDANITAVSLALANNGVPSQEFLSLGGLNGKGKRAMAPDGSAYAVKAGDAIPAGGTVDLPPTYGGVINIHDDFDVEDWYLTSLYRSNTVVPSIIMKSLIPATFDFNKFYGTDKPFPWYLQPFYTAHFLADKCDKYIKGKRKFLSIGGGRLKTFFPNGRVITPFDLITLVYLAYRTIQNSQAQATYVQTNQVNTTPPPTAISSTGGVANETKTMTNFFLLLSTTMMAAQRKFNASQVVPASSPFMQHSTGPATGFIAPQFNWVDPSVNGFKLPKAITHCIENLGSVILDGVLCIPVSLFQQGGTLQSYPLTPAQIAGPVGLSAYGFRVDNLQTYPSPNINSYNLGPKPNTNIVPVNITLGGLNINPAYATTYTGYDAGSGNLYPMHLTGTYVEEWKEELHRFVLGGNLINTLEKNLCEVKETKLGRLAGIINDVIPDVSSVRYDTLVPANLSVNGNPSQALSQPVIARFPIASFSSPILLSTAKAISSIMEGWCLAFNQSSTQSNANVLWANAAMVAMFQQTAAPAITQAIAAGAYNATTISGNGIIGAFSKIMAEILAPDSDFGNAKKELASAMIGVGGTVARGTKLLLKRISDNPAYEGILLRAESSIFGEAGWTNAVNPSNMGKIGNDMPADSAHTFAVLDSHTLATTDDNDTEPALGQQPDMMMLKLNGNRIKKVGKVCKVVASKTIEGLKNVTEIANGVGSAINASSAMIGALG